MEILNELTARIVMVSVNRKYWKFDVHVRVLIIYRLVERIKINRLVTFDLK